ncbi:MAG: hypothetical protein RLZZ206_544 [Cyanobacteriota bacterium]|jgi:hypothetical protein
MPGILFMARRTGKLWDMFAGLELLTCRYLQIFFMLLLLFHAKLLHHPGSRQMRVPSTSDRDHLSQ